MIIEPTNNMSKEYTANFTGHRPSKKYDTEFMYDFKNPKTTKLKDELLVVLEDLIVNHNVTTFISGGALGFDQICFWAVEILKKKYPSIKNVVTIPFEKFNHAWKCRDCKQCFHISQDREDFKPKCEHCTFKNTQEMYYKMLKRADKVIFVDSVQGYGINNIKTGEYHISKLNRRNEYMVDNSNITIAYWNGLPSGTKNCIDYAKKQNKKIINIFK